jgi:hypothetical protein
MKLIGWSSLRRIKKFKLLKSMMKTLTCRYRSKICVKTSIRQKVKMRLTCLKSVILRIQNKSCFIRLKAWKVINMKMINKLAI